VLTVLKLTKTPSELTRRIVLLQADGQCPALMSFTDAKPPANQGVDRLDGRPIASTASVS
jgi:hypothetical protein